MLLVGNRFAVDYWSIRKLIHKGKTKPTSGGQLAVNKINLIYIKVLVDILTNPSVDKPLKKYMHA